MAAFLVEAVQQQLPDLERQEIAGRQQQLPLSVCQQILRYGGHVGAVIEHHPYLPRAMEHARQYITTQEQQRGPVDSGRLILADTLSAPRGRFQRQWHAPRGGLWGCLLLANTLLPEARGLLPLALGVACCESLHALGFTDASLRWVNDVLLGGRKTAGFLIESYTSPIFHEDFDLLGLAVNVNNQQFPEDLRDTAASVAGFSGHQVAIHRFLAEFLIKLRWNIGLLHFEEARQLAEQEMNARSEHRLLDRWRQLTSTLGRQLIFGFDVLRQPQYQARAIDIDARGGLILEHREGWRSVEYSGEVRYLE